jgi:hypothetical protein
MNQLQRTLQAASPRRSSRIEHDMATIKATSPQTIETSVREANPAWLTEEPTGPCPMPPVTPRAATLNFLGLGWPDFERLCRRLAARAGDVVAAWAYGSQGHTQLGIDVLIRKKDGTFEAWQSKRHQAFGPANVRDAIKAFLDADWAKDAKRFVLAVACAPTPSVIDEIETARTQLAENGIEFEPLFVEHLTDRLRPEPEIVHDFFSREWVEVICGKDRADLLKDRLSRFDIADVRKRLLDLYGTWIATVDPGLPLAGHDVDGRPIPTPRLSQRYVLPDIQWGSAGADSTPQDQPKDSRQGGEQEAGERDDRVSGNNTSLRTTAPTQPRERTISVAQFLAEAPHAIIIAEAGAGKTTFLRYVALEILSDTPMEAVRVRYGGQVPVWIPFALWARMTEDAGQPVTLGDAACRFITALGDAALGNDVKRAITMRRCVFLVDGIDEARNPTVAASLLVALTVTSERIGVGVLATSRPHGLKALSGIGGNWTRVRLAPLTDAQRGALALLWYRILERQELGASAAESAVEVAAERRADNFVAALAKASGIARLAQTPLFLLALLKLHRLGHDLPRNRFEASREIVKQLLDDQPRRRAKDAGRTDNTAVDSRVRDRILEDFAFGLHSGELKGVVADGALEQDAFDRATALVHPRVGTLEAAETQARSVLSFSEESSGLLVKKTPDHLGFLHRSLQEYFVGRKLAQLPSADRVAFIKANAANGLWSEPILYLLDQIEQEHEVGILVDAIQGADATDVESKAARDALLTAAVFANFAHDIPKVRELAREQFEELELFAWGERRRQLIASVTDGLFSQAVADQCSAKISEWVPDYHGYGRAGAITAIIGWPEAGQKAAIPALLRVIAGDQEHVSRETTHVLAAIAKGDAAIKAQLLGLIRRPRSIETLHAVFLALGRGWSREGDVGALAKELRRSASASLKIDAIRVRAERGDTDEEDLNIFATLAFDDEQFPNDITAPDLLSHFAKTMQQQLVHRIERALSREDNRRSQRTLVGSLVLADPTHKDIVRHLKDLLQQDYVFHDIFTRGSFPVDRVTWTPDLQTIIDKHVAKKESHSGYELYWVSKFLPLPSIKAQLLKSMMDGEPDFWTSRALAEVWGRNDPEVVAAFRSLIGGSAKALSMAGDELPLIIDDAALCRAELIRALREKPRRSSFLLHGLKRLGILASDEEAVRASLEAGDLTGPTFMDEEWRGSLVDTFPEHPEVRAIAMNEIMRYDGNLSVVARQYGGIASVRDAIIKVISPLSQQGRMALIAMLEPAAQSSEVAFKPLAEARKDAEGAVHGEAVMAWAKAAVTMDRLSEDDEAFLATELEAIGPQLDHRRAAAVVALGMADKLSHFVELKDYKNEPETIRVTSISFTRAQDRYLDRMLPHWDRFSSALGGDEHVLARLELNPEISMSALNSGIPNAEHLFALLNARVPNSVHANSDEHMAALVKFSPESDQLREMVMGTILRRGRANDGRGFRSNREQWPFMVAAGVFADVFGRNVALLRKVADAFDKSPQNATAAAALAEVTLRRPDSAIDRLLADKAAGARYDMVSTFRVTAAVGSMESLIGFINKLMKRDPRETFGWNCAYWVPAVLRRIARDPMAADAIIAALASAPSNSARLSLLALLGKGSADRAKIRPILLQALAEDEKADVPCFGFDITSEQSRLLRHTVRELLT